MQNSGIVCNYALVSGDYPVNYYFSVIPDNVSNMYQGYWLNTNDKIYSLMGLDSRAVLNAVSSVKYYLSDEDNLAPYGFEKQGEYTNTSGKQVYIYENKDALPLGYTYDEILLKADYEQMSALEKERSLIDYAVVAEAKGAIPVTAELPQYKITEKPIELTEETKEILEEHQLNGEKGESIELQFVGEENSETFLCLRGIEFDKQGGKRTFTVNSVNARNTFKIFASESAIHYSREGVLANLGYGDRAIDSCEIAFTDSQKIKATIDQMSVICASMDGVEEAVAARKAECLENIEISTNRVSGMIRVSKDKVLQLSIPYSSGWKAYVDGKAVETFASGVAYTGIYISEGAHEVVLRYTSPGIVAGLCCTAAAWLILIAVVIYKRKTKGKQ